MDQEREGLEEQTDLEEVSPSDQESQSDFGYRTAGQERQRMMKIKSAVSVIAIIAVAALAFFFWNDDGNYQISISTDEGYTWQCEIADESVVRIASEETQDGKYTCVLEGVSAGDAQVELTRTETGNPDKVAEERVYNFTVTDDNFIIQKSVNRELFE